MTASVVAHHLDAAPLDSVFSSQAFPVTRAGRFVSAVFLSPYSVKRKNELSGLSPAVLAFSAESHKMQTHVATNGW